MMPGQIAVCAVLVAAIGFGSGWVANGWRLSEQIADIKRQRAEEHSQQTQAALDEIQSASKTIQTAAAGAQANVTAVHSQLAEIRKERRNAKPPALPADCRMDPIRVRSIEDAATVVDQTITGSKPSR